MNRRLIIFLSFFTGLNLLFIPMMSLYGLRVCPVLPIVGFRFGCAYSAVFILFSNITNLGVILLVRSKRNHPSLNLFLSQQYRLRFLAATYLLSTLIAIGVLQFMLNMNHLSNSRGPEILALASILIGITHAYGLNWAFFERGNSDNRPRTSTFKKLWISHVARMSVPIIVFAVVLLHFLLRQSVSLNGGKTAPPSSHDELIQQSSYVVEFLLAWLAVTFSFYFLSERDHARQVQDHFSHLQEMDLKYRSDSNEAWGLWAAFIDQLNSFSKMFGERTQLLKSFSRFVTAEVAEKALLHELKEATGTSRELTVIMSDIRSFTGLSEILSPSQVVTLLNEYFTAMLDVTAKFRVSVDKFIGDGILAYVEPDSEGNGDQIDENRRGVEAAFAMTAGLQELNLRLKAMGLPDIKIGIAVYRGPLIIGLIGSEAKLQHTIIGDTVNRTARLEGLCKDLSVAIVVAENVWRSLTDDSRARFKSFGHLNIKGLNESIDVYGVPFGAAP